MYAQTDIISHTNAFSIPQESVPFYQLSFLLLWIESNKSVTLSDLCALWHFLVERHQASLSVDTRGPSLTASTLIYVVVCPCSYSCTAVAGSGQEQWPSLLWPTMPHLCCPLWTPRRPHLLQNSGPREREERSDFTGERC